MVEEYDELVINNHGDQNEKVISLMMCDTKWFCMARW
jgi:hypothetical protein